MKNTIKNIALAVGFMAGTAFSLTSCEDMMTIETGDKAYINANDTLYSYLGIMRAMQDVAERQVILGEIRGDLVASTENATDTLFAISNFDDPKDGSCSMLQVSDYYNVINNCNFYIHNCDTNTIKSNVKFMIPEYAQVKAIRAWAYLQLVKNYGSVPYITEPIKNLDVIKNFDYQNNQVNKDNLIDKLVEDGLLNLMDTKYPQYGSGNIKYGEWDNGNTKISARMCYIPIRIVLGDSYLLRGQSQADYEKAAQMYFDYLKNETTPMYPQYYNVSGRRGIVYTISMGGSWGRWASTYTYNEKTNEVITIIPSSANAGLGKMLTRVADIYGYTPTSSQSSSEITKTNDKGDKEGTGEYESSGAITVTRNYKRQYCPSNGYKAVNDAQTSVSYSGTTSLNPIISYDKNIDGRMQGSIENYTTIIDGKGETYPLCGKAARGDAFYYSVPIYRKTLIWLRLAEAINRAGYPEYAFAILKDGINKYSLPKIVDRLPEHFDNGYGLYVKASTNDSLYYDYDNNVWYAKDSLGNFVEGKKTIGFVVARDTIPNDSIVYGTAGQMYYITDTLQMNKFNAFLNFKDDVWNSTYGIHARGCGFGSWTSANQDEVTTNLSGYRDSVYFDYKKLLLAQGVTLGKSSKDEVINAVENLIVDELALETAFEGNRFTDLVRIAEHKNASGFKGTEWLAKKIANRDYRPAAGDEIKEEGSFNSTLYSKLLDIKNWFFSLPSWSVK